MIMKDFIIKENPKLIIKDQNIEFIKEHLEYQRDSNMALIRNYFTLTATSSDMKYLDLLTTQSISMDNHFGYTSVGIVEEAGGLVDTMKKGDIILSAGIFSRYHLLNTGDNSNITEVFYKSSYQQFDLVDLLFLPLICIAFDLVNKVTSDSYEKIIFYGESQVFLILALLLQEEGYDVVVYCNQLKDDSLTQFLGDNVELLTEENLFFRKIKQEDVIGIYFGVGQKELSWDGKIYDAESIKFDYPPWKMPHLLRLGVDILLQRKMKLHNMIAQHVHGEYIKQTKSYLEKGYYQGRLLVYDW